MRHFRSCSAFTIQIRRRRSGSTPAARYNKAAPTPFVFPAPNSSTQAVCTVRWQATPARYRSIR
jgi:hypothetical protein